MLGRIECNETICVFSSGRHMLVWVFPDFSCSINSYKTLSTTYQHTCLLTYNLSSMFLFSFLPLSINLSIHLISLSTHPFHLPIHPSLFISIYLSSIYPPPSIYLFVDVDDVGTHSDNFHWLVLPSPSCCNGWLITCTNFFAENFSWSNRSCFTLEALHPSSLPQWQTSGNDWHSIKGQPSCFRVGQFLC